MYSVVEIGGEQLRVAVGDTVRVNPIEAPEKKVIGLDRILLFAEGKDVAVGKPLVEKAAVKARVLGHGKGDKILVFKKKRRKGYKRKVGVRPPYTELLITELQWGTKKQTITDIEKKKPKKAPPEKAAPKGDKKPAAAKPKPKADTPKAAPKTAPKAAAKAPAPKAVKKTVKKKTT